MKTQTLHNQLVEWRHDLHMHPQISFEEEYASNKVSTLLREFGIDVHNGIARTGVVALVTYEFCPAKVKSKSYNELPSMS